MDWLEFDAIIGRLLLVYAFLKRDGEVLRANIPHSTFWLKASRHDQPVGRGFYYAHDQSMRERVCCEIEIP